MLLYALNEGIMVSGDYKNRRDYTGLVSIEATQNRDFKVLFPTMLKPRTAGNGSGN